MSDGAGPAFGELVYLYVGTDDVERDRAFYLEALGAEPVWRFAAFADPEHENAVR